MKKIIVTILVFSCFFSFSQVKPSKETVTDEVPFSVIERVPVYQGCDKTSSNIELKKCMTDRVRKHVARKFNTDLGDSLGISGRQRIITMFKINKEGKIIDIKARASHPALETEAIRVIDLIPPMVAPGYQKGKPVIVPYSLPIQFEIVGETKRLTKKEKRRQRKEELLKKVKQKN